MRYDVRKPSLAPQGKDRIKWSSKRMGVLSLIRERFARQKPFKGINIGACLHVTTETANLCITLVSGGAKVSLCASNPLSTQDDVAASLVKDFGIQVFALKGEDTKKYYDHIHSVLDERPVITLDDGADLINTIHKERKELIGRVMASMEETTTGVTRLKAMHKAGMLMIPVIAVNDAHVKYLFDNRYGTGQSTLDGIIRATNMLFAGKTIVVCGYGWCGRGFAMRARGMGANVVVTEVDSIKALEACMDGFKVMTLKEAARVGDIFCTISGNKDVIRKEHFLLMKNGAILCNSGHFDVEIDLKGLKAISRKIVKNVRENIDEYILKNGKSLYLLAKGRLVNLACAEGHPSEVMDMSFSTQALMAEHVKRKKKFEVKVHNVPWHIEQRVARLKLRCMGVKIDRLTKEQIKYLSDWKEGT